MEHRKQPKIEAIYPLSYMQQGLLFHHLSSEWDQGFLHLECILKGTLDRITFENAWQQISYRHPILRTTIEWEALEKPVQITHGHKPMVFSYHNWTKHSEKQREVMLANLKEENRESGAHLKTGPLSHIILIKIKEEEHILLWPCHHLLIDGWSSHSILREVFELYGALTQEKEVSFDTLPSQKAYLNWLKELRDEESKTFWQDYFESFDLPHLFNSANLRLNIVQPERYRLQLSQKLTADLSMVAKENKLTVNTILQSVWSCLLGVYFETDDIVFGTTVSGRSGDFPNIHLLTGMFMNVQPVRIKSKEGSALFEWMNTVQTKQLKARSYEHQGLDKITEQINWPGGQNLFDNLLIFENYPITDTSSQAIRVENVKSGITSTFPLTLVIIPGDRMEFKLSVLPEIIDETLAKWILSGLEQILSKLVRDKPQTIGELKSVLKAPAKPIFFKETKHGAGLEKHYVAPRNEVELKLVQIWEAIFGRDKIGVHDNFFDLGGKSLMAVKMFVNINKNLEQKFSPTTILEFPTISEIGELILGEKKLVTSDWKNLVPIRASGFKRPLFCLHAGGGHVFFYSPLAAYMDEDRPIYALQPSGIFGEDTFHQSIEEMAKDYVTEIRKVQTKGPYNILVYCFSTALGLEMSKLFADRGETSNLIVMDTMTDQDQLLTKQRFMMRFYGFLNRLSKNPFQVARYMIGDRIEGHLKPLWIQLFGNAEQKNTEKIRIHLEKIYNNYHWETYPGEINLILTSKADKRFNEELIRSWSLVATGEVKVTYTKGSHRSIFEKPEVVFAAEAVDKCCV